MQEFRRISSNFPLIGYGYYQLKAQYEAHGEVKERLLLLFIRDVGTGLQIFIQSNRRVAKGVCMMYDDGKNYCLRDVK